MGSQNFRSEPPRPWIETPLIPSLPLSKAAGCNIFLKLDNLQPSGSFKSRGIGNMMQRAASASASASSKNTHFYCSSGGNAGLACATTAATLQRPCTIVLPESAPAVVEAKLTAMGASVVRTGINWAAADGHLRNVLLANHRNLHGEDSEPVYVPPFDHPDVWAGAATLVDEVVEQFPAARRAAPREVDDDDGYSSTRPAIDGIVCSVGGGGLLNGMMEGLGRQRHQQRGHDGRPTRVLAVETVGADSLNASVRAGEHVTLPGITSIAGSLGATCVSDRTWEWAQKHALDPKGERNTLVSATVSDAQAALACVKFADDARILIEISCGATVAMAYNGGLRRYLGGEGLSDGEWARRNVVLVVCGGNITSLELLERYRELYGGAFDK